jgi:hypothetical protein
LRHCRGGGHRVFPQEIAQAKMIRALQRGGELFFEKIPQARQLNDVIPGQYRANQIKLRRGVNFIQMTLRFWLRHKLLDALVESAVNDHVGTRAK